MLVIKCFRSRKLEGEYRTLYKELPDDESKFYQYFSREAISTVVKIGYGKCSIS
jgi:tRNA G46 methylase TrmB